MKLLVIYPYVPWPLDRGTYQRTFHLLKALAQHHQVDLLALTENPAEDESKKPVFEAFCENVELLPFSHPEWQKLFPHRLLNPLPSNVTHWQSDSVKASIDQHLQPGRYDLVHVCDLVLMPYVLPHRHHTPFVVDRSRVDLQFQWMEHRALEFSMREKILRWESYAKLWRYEKILARKALLQVVCGPDDETFIRRHIRRDAAVKVVANGVDLDYFDASIVDEKREPTPTIMFCGAMDYSPNVDALRWYFRDVHPLLMQKMPQTRTWVVGKNPVAEVTAHGRLDGVTVTGGVPDVRPYYRKAWLQIVPLRIGGGTRLKIVESLAIGTPVVSTTIGAQGLDLQHGEEILLADDAHNFASAIEQLLRDEGLRSRIEAAGSTTAKQRFGWPAIGKQLADDYQSRLEHSPNPSTSS